MSISAAMVKELRERTGSGMMECKKALVETNGDIEAAIELMRKSGLAKADKKASRIAAEGIIAMLVSNDGHSGVIVEINSETDFVARGDDFNEFSNTVARRALDAKASGAKELLALPYDAKGGDTIDQRRQQLVAKIGENVSVRRCTVIGAAGATIGAYLHGTKIGVLVEMKGGTADVAKDVAMHIAASRPMCVRPDEVPAETIEKERDIYAAQAAESGKPAEIVKKMVEGRVTKYLKEISLLGQPFVKDPETTIEQLLKKNQAEVIRFERFEVGEGIEKKVDNFAEEVMAQVRGS